MNTGVLIFSGYNQRAVISFCRFAEKNNILYFIIAQSLSDTIFLTEYKRKVLCIRKNNNFDNDDFIYYKSKTGLTNLIILPSTEFLNRFILKERKSLETLGFIIPLCNEEVYIKISDKKEFSTICKNADIMIPNEYVSDNLQYPFVAKPLKYISNNNLIQKPVIIHNKKEYQHFNKTYNFDDFYLQEYIYGQSIYLLLYINSNSNYSIYSQKNLIQQSCGLSIIAAESSDHYKSNEFIKYYKLLKELGFFGLIMIEVRGDNFNFKMIEANPRLWGPSQLILDADMDLFYKFCYDYNLINNIPKLNYKEGIKYFWSGGIYLDNRDNKEIAFHDYTKNDFFDNYSCLTKNDIYLADDTMQLFLKERGK